MSSRASAATVLFLALTAGINPLPAQTPETISRRDRVLIASRIYHEIASFFPDLQKQQFQRDYADYVAEILGTTDDRRSFDLASMALVATLHDSHTWFYDDWLAQNHGQRIGITAYAWDGQWVVVRSGLASIEVGDVIKAVDGTPTQQYFERSRKYISASSDRDATTSFFSTPVVFPERFALTLDEGRQVVIDRRTDKKQPQAAVTEGRWLVPGSVAYIRVPHFQGVGTQAGALEHLKQFHEAPTVILDLRGNPGRGDPGALQKALMDKPYQLWAAHSTMHGGTLLREYDVAYPEVSHVTTSDAVVRPAESAFAGRLVLLVDRGCTCACEDFVMPFKIGKRALLVGETTAGTFSFTNSTRFENGMRLNVSSVRHTFPDGSRFEGVGIPPDVEVHPTIQDLKAKKDVILERALQMSGRK